MNKENDEFLCTTYPRLYRDRRGSPQQTCMAWGFPSGDGWFYLIRKLSERLEALGGSIVASQVKEKFGGLRFYIHSEYGEIPAEAFDLCHEAESDSWKICQRCGSPGSLRTGGWSRTLCDPCETLYMELPSKRAFWDA